MWFEQADDGSGLGQARELKSVSLAYRNWRGLTAAGSWFVSGAVHLVDPKIVQSLTGFEGGNQPSWLLSSAGPRFRRSKRITILREHLWILASRRAFGRGQ